MKWSPLHAAACIAALSLSALMQIRVSADQSSSKSVSPSERGVSPSQPKPSPAPQTAAPDRHLTRGQYLARTALSYRGVPYHWGGRSVRSGFDCSGLVQTVCAKWGLYLPRVARAQYKIGVPVKPADLQPGDLVFFKNTYRRGLSHVGIYIGDNLFIHAPGHGKVVMVSRLDEGYHKRHWAGARRLDLSKLPKAPGEDAPPTQVVIEESPDTATFQPPPSSDDKP